MPEEGRTRVCDRACALSKVAQRPVSVYRKLDFTSGAARRESWLCTPLAFSRLPPHFVSSRQRNGPPPSLRDTARASAAAGGIGKSAKNTSEALRFFTMENLFERRGET